MCRSIHVQVLDWYILDGNQTTVCDAANVDAHLFNPFAVDTQTGVTRAGLLL